jgi:hypothetical protein
MITIVTAPGRSGTSLTMQMLQAAGISLMWNRLPNRSEINPFGHYELNQYRWTPEYAREILPQCEGKAVKIQPRNLDMLTDDHDYQFITIYRDAVNVRDSQKVMHRVQKRETEHPNLDEHLAVIRRNQKMLRALVREHRGVRVKFSQLFNGQAQQAIGKFMGFDALQIAKMNDCVEQTLWHFKPNSLSTGANA